MFIASVYLVVSFALSYYSFCLYFTGNCSGNWWCGQGGHSSLRYYTLNGGRYSSSVDCEVIDTESSVLDHSYLDFREMDQERNYQNSGNSILEMEAVKECPSADSPNTKQVICFSFSGRCYMFCVVP